MSEPDWLTISRELQALAQTGLTYSRDPFDRQRFERIREIAAHLMGAGSATDPQLIVDLFRQDTGYPTPKVDVRAAAFSDAKILMVREAGDGLWTLPGGWADVNQSASDCALRELKEESGFEGRALKLAAVWDYARQDHVPRHPASIYKIFFLCELTGGAASASNETTEVGFFAADALPPLSGGRITTAQILRMFEHAAHPDLPTDFD